MNATNALTRAITLCAQPTDSQRVALLRAIVWFNSMWSSPHRTTRNADLLVSLLTNPQGPLPSRDHLNPHVDHFVQTWRAAPVWAGADQLVAPPSVSAILTFLAGPP